MKGDAIAQDTSERAAIEVDAFSEYILLQTQLIESLALTTNDEEICHIAAYFIPKLVEVHKCQFFKLNGKAQFSLISIEKALNQTEIEAALSPLSVSMIRQALQEKKPAILNRIPETSSYNIALENGITSMMVAPVFIQKETLGIIKLTRTDGIPFAEVDENLIRQISALIGLRFERNYLQRTTNEHLKKTTHSAQTNIMLNEMHCKLEMVDSVEELYQLTAEWTRKILDCEFTCIAKYQLNSNQVHILQEDTHDASEVLGPELCLQDSSFIEPMILRKIVQSNGLSESPYDDHQQLYKALEVHSEISSPLIVAGTMYGTIRAASAKERPFNDEEENLLLRIASHVSIWIDNFRSKNDLEIRASELEQANSQLNVTIHNLNERETELRHSLETNKELLGITSHDLKNPIGGIIGLCDMIQEDLGELQGETLAEIEENTELIKHEAEHMLLTIKNLLDKHRKEVKHQFDIQRTDIQQLILEVIRGNQSQANAKLITLHYTAGQETHYYVDALSLQRAIDNFLSNAIKYSPQESNVWIELQPRAHDGSYWKLSIRDEGPGLNESDMQRVFRKMQRLSAKPTGGEHSTGLGLYIVKQIVEQHGGTVGVDSVYGEGATFWMLLPHFDAYLDKFQLESAIHP